MRIFTRHVLAQLTKLFLLALTALTALFLIGGLVNEALRLFKNGLREAVVAACKDAGYTFVTLDLQGYRTGAMNEAFA